MASLEDARHYLTIKPVPPWELAKDAKLKARSFDQYNLGSPTRYDMFKCNYMRRLRQISSQGFMSSQSKPYEPVGCLVLNVKDLVKKTLGQDRDGGEPESPRKKTLKQEAVLSVRSVRSERIARRPATSPIYSSRSSPGSRKPLHQLQDIPSNLNAVENTKYSVKMGHPLFKVLDAKESSQTPTWKGKRLQISEVEGPDGDCNEKDGPVMKKQEIEEAVRQPGPRSLPVPQWLVNLERKVTVREPSPEEDDMAMRSHSSMGFAQPKSEAGTELKTYFLWRQLCALHWLIEACRIQQGLTQISHSECLVPLADCWNVVRPGGSTMPKVVMTPDSLERIMSTSSLQVPSRSPSRSTSVSGTPSTMAPGTWSFPASPRRVRETAWSVESPHTPVSVPLIRLNVLPESPSAEQSDKRKGSPEVSDFEDTSNYHNNLVKLLDTVQESVGKEMLFRERIADDEAERKGKLRTPVYQWALTPYPKASPPVRARKNEAKMPDANLGSQQVVKRAAIRPRTAGPTMRHLGSPELRRAESAQQPSGHSQRRAITPTKRPRSSPPKLTLRLNMASFSSDRREKTIVKLREQFQEVTDLKALRLHQSLTELQRSRWDRMEKKIEAFQVRQLSMHRDLKVMRSAASRESSRERASSRQVSPTTAAMNCEWYCTLVDVTSAQDSNDKPCRVVLKRLEESAARFMGWQSPDITSPGRRSKSGNIMDNQLTSESFVAVLRRLRPFEILAPDVSAAIEFTKIHIVKLPGEQFEEVIRKLI